MSEFTGQNKIIFIDDDADLLAAQTQALELADFLVQPFSNGPDALKTIDANFDGVIITDVRMPHMDGLELFKRIKEIDADIPVILITGHGDVPMAVQALKDGVYDFITKPFAADNIQASLTRALQKRQLVLENRQLRALHINQDPAKTILVGNTPIMIQLRQTVTRIASAGVDALITGDTGVGKESVARALHKLSARRSKPFVHINCAALREETAQAELFGVEAGLKFGPYTSKTRTIGHIERAHKGTLFLDDIDGLSLSQQANLLHVVEARELWPVGAESPQSLDLRIFVATKKDLAQLVKAGQFREDLYYRLSGVTLRVPPLSERKEDIPLLFNHFLLSACARFNLPTPKLTLATSSYLKQHLWPGNVRELEQFAERYALDLDDARAPGFSSRAGLGSQAETSLADCVNRYEAELIRETLLQVNGSAKIAMESLKLPRKTFYDKINRYNINLADYRLQKQSTD